jgi:hypothetical protein
VVFGAVSRFVQQRKGETMDDNNSGNVTIVDIRMPFMSMVVFMVKAAIAAIPAVIILSIIGMVVGAIFGGIFGGMSY